MPIAHVPCLLPHIWCPNFPMPHVQCPMHHAPCPICSPFVNLFAFKINFSNLFFLIFFIIINYWGYLTLPQLKVIFLRVVIMVHILIFCPWWNDGHSCATPNKNIASAILVARWRHRSCYILSSSYLLVKDILISSKVWNNPKMQFLPKWYS